MRLIVAEAVAAGIKQAASDPELWADALTAMRTRAAASTGNLVLGAVAGLARRVAWVAVIGAGLYALGGWSAIGAAFKAWTAAGK